MFCTIGNLEGKFGPFNLFSYLTEPTTAKHNIAIHFK